MHDKIVGHTCYNDPTNKMVYYVSGPDLLPACVKCLGLVFEDVVSHAQGVGFNKVLPHKVMKAEVEQHAVCIVHFGIECNNIVIAPCPLPVYEVLKSVDALVHLTNQLAYGGFISRDPKEEINNVGGKPMHKDPVDAIIYLEIVISDCWWTENDFKQIIIFAAYHNYKFDSQQDILKWIFIGNPYANFCQLFPSERILTSRVAVVHRYILHPSLFILDRGPPGCSHHQINDNINGNHVCNEVRIAIQGAEHSMENSNNDAYERNICWLRLKLNSTVLLSQSPVAPLRLSTHPLIGPLIPATTIEGLMMAIGRSSLWSSTTCSAMAFVYVYVLGLSPITSFVRSTLFTSEIYLNRRETLDKYLVRRTSSSRPVFGLFNHLNLENIRLVKRYCYMSDKFPVFFNTY
jgi:hypothetical protein